MIISKPKRSTLLSLGLFLILVGALIAATLSTINRSENIYWYHYLFLVILVPIGGGVFLKVVLSYKITSFGKRKINLKVPVKFKTRSYDISEIKHWQEVTIKTTSGVYQQVELRFVNEDKITLGRQEHSNYDAVIKYLQQKAGKKKIT